MSSKKPVSNERVLTQEVERDVPSFDRSRFNSLVEARAYHAWKQDVPEPIRHVVESAMLGKKHVPTATGLSRTDAFITAFSKSLIQKDVSTDPFISGLRSVETNSGMSDGLALLADKEGSFAMKRNIYVQHIDPILRWLTEQDLAPPEEDVDPRVREDDDGSEVEQQQTTSSEDEDLVPQEQPDSFRPSMDEQGEQQEGEPKAFFTVTPFYGGYYREHVWPIWNARTLEWKKSQGTEQLLKQERHDPLSVRVMKGIIPAHKTIALPLPYGWTVDIDTIEADIPRNKIQFTQDQRGTIFIRVEGRKNVPIAFRIAKQHTPKIIADAPEPLTQEATHVPSELQKIISEIVASTLSSSAKARLLLKTVREHLVYSQESALNAVYASNPATYVDRVWQEKKADCDVANTVGALVLRSAGIQCRMVTGHYIKSGTPDDRALMTSGTKHAWLEVYDDVTHTWFRADATPKGDPTLDEERPDEEQSQSGEGDYGEQEAELMSDEELEKLMRELERIQPKYEPTKTPEQRIAESFAHEAECTPEKARAVLDLFERVRQLKDAEGLCIQQKMMDAWNKLVRGRLVETHVYEGPVTRDEGDELEDPVTFQIDVQAGDRNPSGFEIIRTREKQEKLFGGLDIYLLLDCSGSMAEEDPVTHRIKSDLQRDVVMLYADTLMQCALLARRKSGKLSAPLGIRLQVVSIHGTVSVDLPLTGEWTPREQVKLYDAVMQVATNGTPDHAGLAVIEERIRQERETWKTKPHKPNEKPPIEFVVTTLDGESNDPGAVKGALGRLRALGVVDYAYGMTATSKPIEAIYAPNAKTVEDLPALHGIIAEKTLNVFRALYPANIKK